MPHQTRPWSIGQRIRHMRERQNWSQARLAQELDKYAARVSISSINRWENDKAVPGPYYRERLCLLFQVSGEELFGAPETPQAETALQPATEESRPIWNVPYLRNQYFTGREDLLERLREILTSRRNVGAFIALSGLGGIGKTQLSVEYAYRYADDYEAVLWVRADTLQLLHSDFLALADLLDLPEKQEIDQERVVNAVMNWLRTHKHWLLILDNVDDLEQVMAFLPRRGEGQTLLTMRAYATGSTIKGIEIDTLGLEEGASLILRRAKLLGEEESFEQVPETIRKDAEQIADLLGGLPLALDQVGAYIEENQCSLADYLALYQKRAIDLLKRRGRVYPLSYPHAVATTWSMSFVRIEQLHPGAADLLRLCAFLHPNSIPEAMLLAGKVDLGPLLRPLIADPLAWNEAIGVLRRYALVRRTAETRALSIHRLVQVVLKEAMDPEVYRQWAERAIQVVNAAFPGPEEGPAAWPICQQYLAHALICAQLIQQENILTQEAASLLYLTGCYLHNRGLQDEAEPLERQALAIREQVLGPEHPETASSLNDLAILYHHHGQYEQAERLYQRALAIREQVLGPEHPETAESLNNLATLYQRQGRYEQAEVLYQRSLRINERIRGEQHPFTALSFNMLAVLFRQQGKYEQAEELHRRALSINEQVLGPEHPFTAFSLSTLADLYRDQGRHKQAEELYRRALAIRERALGLEHPLVAESLQGLADLFRVQERYEQAEELLGRVLAIRKQTLGMTHPDVAESLTSLAICYQNQGKPEEALLLLRQALQIAEQSLGAQHPIVAEIRQRHSALSGDG